MEDNLEEFGYISDEDLESIRTQCESADKSGYGVIAAFGGTGIGDVAFVPGSMLKHPKGIRDIEEWYIATLTNQDYLHAVFEKQTDIYPSVYTPYGKMYVLLFLSYITFLIIGIRVGSVNDNES